MMYVSSFNLLKLIFNKNFIFNNRLYIIIYRIYYYNRLCIKFIIIKIKLNDTCIFPLSIRDV